MVEDDFVPRIKVCQVNNGLSPEQWLMCYSITFMFHINILMANKMTTLNHGDFWAACAFIISGVNTERVAVRRHIMSNNHNITIYHVIPHRYHNITIYHVIPHRYHIIIHIDYDHNILLKTTISNTLCFQDILIIAKANFSFSKGFMCEKRVPLWPAPPLLFWPHRRSINLVFIWTWSELVAWTWWRNQGFCMTWTYPATTKYHVFITTRGQ